MWMLISQLLDGLIPADSVLPDSNARFTYAHALLYAIFTTEKNVSSQLDSVYQLLSTMSLESKTG